MYGITPVLGSAGCVVQGLYCQKCLQTVSGTSRYVTLTSTKRFLYVP
jgi:hypothetical protein